MTTPSDKAILEQYKLMVEMADRTSGRRQTANSFFFSIVSLLMVVNSFSWVIPRWQLEVSATTPQWQHTIAITSVTVLVCYAWIRILEGYRAINSAKYRVIQSIEETLPFAMFADEYKHMKSEDRHRFTRLTVIEQRLPKLFAGLSVLISTLTILPQICFCP